MKALILLVYLAMAVWLLIASVLRISILLSSGLPLDPLPFISGGLGLLAVVALVPTYEEWRERRDLRRSGVQLDSVTPASQPGSPPGLRDDLGD